MYAQLKLHELNVNSVTIIYSVKYIIIMQLNNHNSSLTYIYNTSVITHRHSRDGLGTVLY